MSLARLVGVTKSKKSLSISTEIQDLCKEICLTKEQLLQTTDIFLGEVARGLRRSKYHESGVKCYNTYVQDLPRGNENGRYLALHVGVKHCRVIVIRLEESNFDMQCKRYNAPKQIKDGTALFDHIADCLQNFIEEYKLDKFLPLPLGFTFSFPLRQDGLGKAILSGWTKSFNVSGVVGNDVAQLLREAIDRKKIDVDVCAVLNDSTGTLLASAWKDHNCRMALIVGTGTNISYVEEIKKVAMFEGDISKKYVVINVESGALGEDGELNFIRSEYDFDLDADSINPGKQILEKMVAVLYLGELVRIMLVQLIGSNMILGGKGSDMIYQRGNFYTEYMFQIESDEGNPISNCRQVLCDLQLPHATDLDCIILRYICQCFSRRSAAIVAALTATLINKMDFETVSVACDGSLYRNHPQYNSLLLEHMALLVKKPKKFDLILSEDGCGRGAALVAAIVTRQKKNLG